MRRFIASLPGKVVSHFVVLALVLPYLTLTLIGRAYAQVQVAPRLAVIELANKKSPGTDFGKLAAKLIANEFSKTNAYEVLPVETVDRGITSLSLTSPVTETTNVIRLGQQLDVGTIVTGDIVDYAVKPVAGGKQAFISMRVIVTDVTSGLPINGSAVVGQSTIRSGDVTDETLITDALGSGVSQAVREIRSRTLPTGTVLNTRGNASGNMALVNQGTRSGFKVGQDVIIVRAGSGQVGNGRVASVDPDQSEVTITRYSLGIQPGDRVRVLFTPPDIRPGFSASGAAKVAKSGGPRFGSSTVTTLLLVGLLVLMVSNSGGGSNAGAADFTARATVQEANGLGAVQLNWRGALFGAGTQNYVNWQIWRSDVTDTPIWVIRDGSARSYTDTQVAKADFDWTLLDGSIGGNACTYQSGDIDDQTATGVAGVVPGTPYSYQLNVVYKVDSSTLTGGSGGTTNSVKVDGSKSIKDRPTTRQTDITWCYFLSSKVSSKTATPIDRPTLNAPASGYTVPTDSESGTLTFQIQSPFVVTAAEVLPQYVLQFSTSQNFTNVYTAGTWTGNNSSTVTTFQFDVNSSQVPSAMRTGDFWWRVGARNGYDQPGPVADKMTNQKYIFSKPNLLKRPVSAGNAK